VLYNIIKFIFSIGGGGDPSWRVVIIIKIGSIGVELFDDVIVGEFHHRSNSRLYRLYWIVCVLVHRLL
jgi:hypothetical protein